MTEEERRLLELYGLSRLVPGKTAAQRVNLLQDIGFDPFGLPEQFIEEEFIGAPEPELVNPVGQAYGRDEKWRNVFGKIESGMDPDSAVDAAIKEGVLPEPGFGDQANNPYDIARQYAIREAENEAAWNEWSRSNQAEAAKFGEKQARLRSQFEAERPLSMADLRGVSQFEAKGAPTVDELMQSVALRRGKERTGKEAPMRGDVIQTPKYQKALRQRLSKRLEESKQTYIPTERSRAAMQNLAFMAMLGQ